MRLDELHPTIYVRQAVDGRRGVERCKTARLVRCERKKELGRWEVGLKVFGWSLDFFTNTKEHWSRPEAPTGVDARSGDPLVIGPA